MIKISKDVFNYPEELTIFDLRLLIILCSGVDFEDLDYKTKRKINRDNSYFNEKFSHSVEKLISLGLLDGKLNPIINNKEYTHVREGSEFSSIRQLFILCIPYWGGSNISIVKTAVFNGLFGETTSVANRNWKATLKQIGCDYTWSKKKNTIHITYGVSKEKTENKREYIKHSDYIKSEHWKEISSKFKDYFGKCQLCSSTKNLQVHHNNYENLYKETDKDLIVLCQSCHAKFHGKA